MLTFFARIMKMVMLCLGNAYSTGLAFIEALKTIFDRVNIQRVV